MKTRTLCSAALLALVSSAVLLPVGASAAPVAGPVPVTGTGSVTFKQGNEEPIVTPPGEEGPVITEPGTPEDYSPLMMIAATPLNFDEHNIEGFTKELVYNAKNFTTTDTANNPVTTENFVKFRDIRGVKNHDYTVSAQLTKQFTATTDESLVLKAATLSFDNAKLVTTEGNAANLPEIDSANTTLKSSFVLAPNAQTGTVSAEAAGDSVEVLSTTGEKGFGVFDIKFGDLATPGAAEGKTQSEESVKLTIPATAQLTANTYQAEITWTIAEIPATTPEV
ncbi:hypothetical protein BAU15_07975 [Enterococcus sp. JM4C]|uniref:WxL domain-containing protein n=1 Tax=Candidatus Enterococcus huntleyi TaxID=1857217 RepID=UPI0013799116|nr:WxL domain-containing protein [Enterococcus sp. JM4C]KAF1297833.1 hypothetical protein BAU15_07975 [Enterococcus sp. JM4C]